MPKVASTSTGLSVTNITIRGQQVQIEGGKVTSAKSHNRECNFASFFYLGINYNV